MAISVNNNTSSADSYSNSLRGLSGLSGLDRDGMIKTMTLRSRSRIAKLKQKAQTLTWKQEAYQSISDKLVELSRKYFNVMSENSLIREVTFDNYTTEAFGAHKNKITATGSPKSLEGISILGATSKASATQYTTGRVNGSGELTTGELDFTQPIDYGALEGKTLDIKIGLKTSAKEYQVKFVAGNYDIYERDSSGAVVTETIPNPNNASENITVPKLDADKVKNVKELFEKSFKDTEVFLGNNKFSMADFVKVDFKLDSGTKQYQVRIKVNDEKTIGGKPLGSLNAMHIVGGSAMREAGMNPVGSEGFNINITPDGYMLTDTAEALIGGYIPPESGSTSATFQKKSAAELLIGQSISFRLNGVRKSISFPAEKLPGAAGEVKVKKDGIEYDLKNAEDVAQYLDKELKDAYGKGSISVSYDSVTKKMTFTPGNGAVLSIHEESGHLVGDTNVFKIGNGSSNRLALDTDLTKPGNSGLVKKLDAYAQSQGTYSSFAELLAGESKLSFNINGNTIEISTKKIKTFSDLMNELNNTNNVTSRGKTGSEYNSTFKVEYDGNVDNFVFTSNDKGANSQMSASGMWAGSGTDTLESVLFGSYNSSALTEGKNATIFYKTDGSDTVKQLTSFDNNFTINNASFKLEGAFNTTVSGGAAQLVDADAEGVSFKGKVNSDKLVETVKAMVKDYNDLVKAIGTQFKTMAERGKSSRLKYEPLTEEQRKGMSEKEIEKWEAKAKEGILFGDPSLRATRDELAGAIYFNNSSVAMLAKIGISQSTYQSDPNGSLEFNESKFRAAVESNPDLVKQAFLGDGGTNVGFSNNMKSIIAQSASDTGTYKGRLVELAGSKYAPNSIFSNNVYKQIEALNKSIKTYETRLKSDEDRYIKRFATLEKIMRKAEMQSGYISNLQGY